MTTSTGGTSIWGDVFKAVLGGVVSYAGAKSKKKSDVESAKLDAELAIKLAGIQGMEGRKTSAFERELEYYYKQLDNKNKRIALDTYGAFSKLGTFAPAGYKLPAAPVVPAMPKPGP